LYLVLLAPWWYAVGGLSVMAALPAGFIYHFFDPQLSVSPDGRVVNVVATATEASGFGGQTHASALKMDTITYGLPLLVALIFVTGADSIRARARALALGFGIMILLSVPAVMLWAKLTSLQLEDRIAMASNFGLSNSSRSGFFYYAFHGYAFSQPVVAVVVWLALLTLGWFKEKPKAEPQTVRASRNDPCPCGSGRKYKRCCGHP
jgi:SEC-C motif-containing protein